MVSTCAADAQSRSLVERGPERSRAALYRSDSFAVCQCASKQTSRSSLGFGHPRFDGSSTRNASLCARPSALSRDFSGLTFIITPANKVHKPSVESKTCAARARADKRHASSYSGGDIEGAKRRRFQRLLRQGIWEQASTSSPLHGHHELLVRGLRNEARRPST